MPFDKMSEADLQALASGDMSKVSDDGLNILSQQSKPQQPAMPEEESLQGGGVRSIADLISPGFGKGAVEGAVDQGSLGNINIDTPSSSPAGQLAGKAGMMVAQGAATGAPIAALETAPARIAASAGAGGLQGFLQKPGGEDTLQNRAVGAGVGTALGAGGQTLGEGSSKLGDYLMQKAVGMKKYMPGMGQKLADEGIIGTKGMMQNQVAEALPRQEARLQEGVSRLQGQIQPEPVADAIRAKASPYIPEPGASGPMPVPSANEPFVNTAMSRADEALNRGAMTPPEALDVSRAIAKPAYNKMGEPVQRFAHQVSQTEAGALKGALKDMGAAQGVPEVSDSLGQQAALLNASRGLNTPESLSSVIAKGALKAAIGGGVGYELGGTAGALAGAAASTPAGQSTAGRAAVGAGKASPYATQALIDALMKAQRSK